MTKTGRIFGIMLFLVFTCAVFVFSQEQTEQKQPEAQASVSEIQPPSAPAAPSQPVVAAEGTVVVPEAKPEQEIQWIWGEVSSIDPQNKNLVVRYLDYETDIEKEVALSVDEKTTFDNVKSIDEIKVKDALSVDYIVSPDGKNIAKNISLEKPEQAPTIAPETTSPAAVEQPAPTAPPETQTAPENPPEAPSAPAAPDTQSTP